ncbi:hypothetical protein F5Y06DRAFT_296952 [Hypoxylon sp. FL0890]|nr:hypothetical protein F5Y06DRAFT_296952 [Hypoxylon sp. FL0890]
MEEMEAYSARVLDRSIEKYGINGGGFTKPSDLVWLDASSANFTNPGNLQEIESDTIMYVMAPGTPSPIPSVEYPPNSQQPDRQPYSYSTLPQPHSYPTLVKMYNHDEHKFGGEKYDIFDEKIKVFKDLCRKAGGGHLQ